MSLISACHILCCQLQDALVRSTPFMLVNKACFLQGLWLYARLAGLSPFLHSQRASCLANGLLNTTHV